MSSPFRFLPSRTAACFVGGALLLILTGGCGSAYNAQAATAGSSDRADTGAAAPAEAPAAAHSDPSSPEAIIARYIEAIGGEAAIRAHTSMTTKAAFELPAMGASGEAIIYQALPGCWWRCRSLGSCATQTCTVGSWVSRVHGR